MTTTLLAVDDSKTMRRVLEITFAGENYRMVLAGSSAEALHKLKSEKPAIALVDAQLGAESGYELCQSIKHENPRLPVLILSSKQRPYDRAKGASVGADDFLDKPFDTQQMLDKVGAVMRKAAEAPAATPAVVSAPAAARPAAQPAPAVASPAMAVRPVPGQTPAFIRPAVTPGPAVPAGQKPVPASAGRPHVPTAAGIPSVSPGTPAPAAAPSRPVVPATPASPPAAVPARVAAPAPVATAAPATATPAVAVAVGAELQSKLQALGLTQDQVQAVLALSREVIEQVVWEVVPVLAETMIEEEIRRLTSS